MRRSNYFMPMRRQRAARAGNKSGDYFEQMGMIAKVGAGIYTHLPAAFHLFRNVKATLNKHLLKAGCSEHQFPAIHPLNIWQESGRFETFGDIMFVFSDQHNKDMCLAPTHEILAALTAKQFIRSYRDLPVRISQIQTKFRDETRPRGGLMRTREFTMHDLYSFDTGFEAGNISYALMREAYERTFVDLRVPFVVKQQDDMGSIGGLMSHEFHVLAEAGEDNYRNPESGHESKSIEVAHIFMLGNQYTKSVNARYTDQDGSSKDIFMCSFGLGIERTVAAYLERYLEDGKDLLWSWSLAPYKVMILGVEHPPADDLYEKLNAAGYETMIDDRKDVPFNQQLKEGLMMGFPIYLILGRKFATEEKVEVKSPLLGTTMYLDIDEVLPHVEALRNEIKDVELIRMTFDILKIDRSSKKVYVNLKSFSQLDNSFCHKVECGTDLLGNFGQRKQLHGSNWLKAGQYWVVPIMQHSNGEKQIKCHNDVSYALTSSLIDEGWEDIGALVIS
jgi:prolyl-tRNA synthetase